MARLYSMSRLIVTTAFLFGISGMGHSAKASDNSNVQMDNGRIAYESALKGCLISTGVKVLPRPPQRSAAVDKRMEESLPGTRPPGDPMSLEEFKQRAGS